MKKPANFIDFQISYYALPKLSEIYLLGRHFIYFYIFKKFFNFTKYLEKALLLLFLSCQLNMATAAQALDRIVAIVGDEAITNSELQHQLTIASNNLQQQNIPIPEKKILESQVLDKMIIDNLQLQLAHQYGLEADGDSVAKAIANMAKNNNLTLSQFKQKIEQEIGSFAEFREHLKKEITISRLHQREILQDIRVSKAEIDGYLNSPAGRDSGDTEYRLGHILLAAPEQPNPEELTSLEIKAKDIISQLKQGKDFKEMAASYSAGAQSLAGGDLGWRKLNEIPSLLVNKVVTMQVNEIAGPIDSPGGLHIIKLQDKRSNTQIPETELRARQIFIKATTDRDEKQIAATLIKLRSQILDGKGSFAQLAITKSEESDTATKGGDLGWFRKNAVLPEFWHKVTQLKVGEISQPFKTDLGWHLVLLEAKREVMLAKNNIREKAAEILREQKFNDALEVWLKKIRSQAKIQKFL